MSLPPDSAGLMPAPALVPPAPVVDPAEAIRQASQGKAVVKASVPPALKLAGQSPGRGGVSAVSGQKTLTQGFDENTPDALTFAAKFAPAVREPMQQARIAAAVDVYSKNLANAGSVDPNGAHAAAQLDWGKVVSLADNDRLGSTDTAKELKRLMRSFQSNPASLSDAEVTGLNDFIRQIGDATAAFDTFDNDDGTVDHIDLLPNGPAPRFAVKNAAVAAKALGQVSGTLPELSESTGLALHLLPDQTSVAVSGPDSKENRDVLRNLYRAVGDIWAPAKPRGIASLSDYGSSLDDVAQIVTETWPAGTWDDLGGHPGLSGDTSITAVMPDGQLPRAFRKLGSVTLPASAGILETPQLPEDAPDLADDESYSRMPARSAERVRRVVVQIAEDADPATAAAEIEMLGGKDVTVYAPGAPPVGWMQARESFFQDPSGGLRVVRTANADRSASHTVNAWVRKQELADSVPGTEKAPEFVQARELARGMYRFGDVTVQAPGLRYEKNDLTAATSAAGRLVGIGMVQVGPAPMLTPVFEGQSEDGFDSYAKVDGDRLQIQASPDDLSPAVRMSQVLQQAGVKASRMSLEGSRLQLA